MRKLIVPAAVSLSVSLSPLPPARAADLAPDVRAAMESINGRQAMAHIKLLSSPFLAGRATGEDGHELAVTYAKIQYESVGIGGGAGAGSFTQSFRLRYTSLGDDNHYNVETHEDDSVAAATFDVGEDFVPFRFSATGSVTAPVVFVGYGIVAPEYDWNDYGGVDVAGKVVLMLRHEPGEKDPDSRFKGKKSTPHSRLLVKVRTAQKNGAAAVLLVNDPLHHDSFSPGSSLARWPQLNPERYEKQGRPIPDSRPVLANRYDDIRIPAVFVSARSVARILAGSRRSLEELQTAIDENMHPDSFRVDGKRVSLEVDFEHRYVPTRNVVAKIVGRDKQLRDEIVIVGGHLDHVGKNWRGEIHPGADDNASGTAGVLEVAKAFSRLAEPPRRTVVFINFAGEELGLLGGYAFVDDPPIPLDKVVGFLNLDMIGRNAPTEVNLVGKRRAPEIHSVVVDSNSEIGLTLKYDAGAGAARSDNFPFQTKGVPAMSFFTGTHDDYHQPGDVASKVIPAKLEKISRLVFLTAYRLAEDIEITPESTRSALQPKSTESEPKKKRKRRGDADGDDK